MLLKFFRKRKNMKRIMWGLAIIIIPAFVIWGAGRSGSREGSKYAGSLFGKKISLDEYMDMWRVTRDNAVRSFGANVPSELIDVMAWNRIILLEAAKKEKIEVRDVEVVKKIHSFPIFQRDGSFDKKLYRSMLAEGARGFEEKVRDDLRIAKLREKKVSSVSVNSEELRREYKKKFEKIKASYISIPFSDFEKMVSYEELSLLDYFNRNKANFRKPQEVNVEYLEIPSSYGEDFGYKVLDYIKESEDLEASSKEFSLDIKETGFFSMQDEVPGIGWSYQFTKASFELKKGEVSNTPIKVNDSLYILKLKEKKEPYTPNFSEVREDVKKAYIKNISIKLARKKAKKVSVFIKKGGGLEDTASRFELALEGTEFITRDDYIPGLGPAGEFVENASSLKQTKIAPPIKMLNAWVILRLDEYQDIDEQKFEEEKLDFRENLVSRKKDEFFDEWFQDFKTQAKFVNYLEKF